MVAAAIYEKTSIISDKKHEKYFTSYKPGDTFWGIGIENETYFELPNQHKVLGKFIQECHKRERYSVDYYETYLKNFFKQTVAKSISPTVEYDLPVLINAHYLTRCDSEGNHITTYEDTPKSNPKFLGKTNIMLLKEADSYFEEEEGNSYCFDGDTIEFMTLNFYKTTVKNVVNELRNHKVEFLKRLNATNPAFCKGEILKYPSKNYGFARMATNMNNVSIFNNGTYHFNFTLPTQLDAKGEIANHKNFVFRHKKAIRFIQFLEPFFIAKYGSGDILSKTSLGLRFPAGSQRCAASRYISVGTYNTENIEIPTGKLLHKERSILEKTWRPYHWYNQLYSQINYKKGDTIGFDINFNKFKNHGIELRIFDWFSEEYLEDVLRILVHILDLAESTPNMPENPLDSKIWHTITYKALWIRDKTTLTKDDIVHIKNYLGVKKINCKKLDICCIFDEIACDLDTRFGNHGPVSKLMLADSLKSNTRTTFLQKLCASLCQR